MAAFFNSMFHFMEIIAFCVTGLIALIIVLMMFPKSPVRDFMLGLSQRIGATATALAFMPPIDTIPVAGEIYDLAALVGIAFYWYTFFKQQERRQLDAQSGKTPIIISDR